MKVEAPRRHKKLVVESQLVPPARGRTPLMRPQIERKLNQIRQEKVGFLVAPAGYGKTAVMLSWLAQHNWPVFWLSLSRKDLDPVVFATHLFYAFHVRGLPVGEDLVKRLEETGLTYSSILDDWLGDLIHEVGEQLHKESILVLDNCEAVSTSHQITCLVSQLVRFLPRRLHLLISSREPIQLPGGLPQIELGALRLTKEDLSFTAEEVDAFLNEYHGLRLTTREVAQLHAKTEGWAGALQVVVEMLQTGTNLQLAEVLDQLPSALGTFFHEALSSVVRAYGEQRYSRLARLAVLEAFDEETCRQLSGGDETWDLVQTLHRRNLFVDRVGTCCYRLHSLLRDFLVRAVDQALIPQLHTNAASLFLDRGETEEAISHLLEAEEFEKATELIMAEAAAMLKTARVQTIRCWLDKLPRDVYRQSSRLWVIQGDAARLAGDFATASEYYINAEEALRVQGDYHGQLEALKGRAQLFLDTAQPLLAELPLKDVISQTPSSDEKEFAEVMRLLAENNLNRGNLGIAKKLYLTSCKLSPGMKDTQLETRMLLREGKLEEARATLEQQVYEVEEIQKARSLPRAHREPTLILSYIYSCMGKAKQASRLAEDALHRARLAGWPQEEQVAYRRLGHAYQLLGFGDKAVDCYSRSIELANTTGCTYLVTEALGGLSTWHSHNGDSALAVKLGQQSIERAKKAGDQYFCNLVQLSVGQALGLSMKFDEAEFQLSQVLRGCRKRGDTYVEALAHLQYGLLAMSKGDEQGFSSHAEQVLNLCQTGKYDFILTKPTLWGPRRKGLMTSFLQGCLELQICGDYCAELLTECVSSWDRESPGMGLEIKTLGQLAISIDGESIDASKWKRSSARRLFEFLLTHRGKPSNKEVIMEAIWPQGGFHAQSNQFYVALHALRDVLAPLGNSSVLREGDSYSLNLPSTAWIDTEVFEELVAIAQQLQQKHIPQARFLYQAALAYYQGNYLEDNLYDEWTLGERRRLLDLYLSASYSLAKLLMEDGRYSDCIKVCHQILARDPCSEEAYRLLMACYWQQGNLSLVSRTFRQCCKTLGEELGGDPDADTVALYKKIRSSCEKLPL